ncbi:copper chaperone PCu(A)C [Sphingomonas sp. ac-8]|uniref:copper chaperone PCu(A)C n=1 Tax=Sphingomonas sp. ac-8 TaxID=3242977 RepID=UPI003A808B23
MSAAQARPAAPRHPECRPVQRLAGRLRRVCRAAPLLALPLLAACSPTDLEVHDAWVRLPAVPGRPAAGYLTLVGGQTDATLVAVTTPAAARTELHETMKTADAGHAAMPGMAGRASAATTMRPLEALPLPAGRTVKLAPGARHLMLFDVDAKVTPGASVPLRLEFADGRTLETQAKAVAAGDAGVE